MVFGELMPHVVVLDLLLHLFARLPEEQVGRHRGAEHGDQRGEPLGTADQARVEQAVEHCTPVDVDGEQHEWVGEQ